MSAASVTFPGATTSTTCRSPRLPTSRSTCILFQHERHYREDQHAILSAAQRRLPRIFLEHDPPRQSPTDTRHPVDDPDTLLEHVTAFNRLMWDNGRTPTRVVEHGVIAPTGVAYEG